MSRKINPDSIYARQLLQAEANIIQYALGITGSQRKAAQSLGVSINFLTNRIQALSVGAAPTNGGIAAPTDGWWQHADVVDEVGASHPAGDYAEEEGDEDEGERDEDSEGAGPATA